MKLQDLPRFHVCLSSPLFFSQTLPFKVTGNQTVYYSFPASSRVRESVLSVSAKKNNNLFESIKQIHVCYSPAGRAVLGKTVPEVSSTARRRRPRAALETEGTVFPNTARPRPVNNIFIYFYVLFLGGRRNC